VQPDTPDLQPIIRTYKGRDKRAAEGAYRADARQAATAGWVPVAHRWTSGWDGHELAVVFEMRASDVLNAPTVASNAAALVGGGPVPAGATGQTGSVGQGAGGVSSAAFGLEAERGKDPGPATRLDPVRETAGGPDVDVAVVAATARDVPVVDEGPPNDVELVDELPDEDDGAAPVVHPPAPAGMTAARAHARASLQTLDLHCAGEPLRLIRTGYPQVPDAPILERRRWVKEHADWARTALILEPRGHRDMYGAVLLPPHRPDADIAVLFMHNEGYSTMCGHGIIAITTGLIEERLYPATEPRTSIRYETPAGLVTAVADVDIGAHGGPEVRQVRFQNVAAYRHAANLVLDLPEIPGFGTAIANGGIRVDLAFGGAYYGIVDAAELGLRVVPENLEALTRAGRSITEALRRDHTPVHPLDPELGFVYGTIIVDEDPASSPDGRARNATLRNVTVFADGEVDRSPCGSGTSALLAHLAAEELIDVGQPLINAGITGEAFEARIEAATMLGDRPAVITSVAGVGYVTGTSSYLIDARDPLGAGFLLR
jgi:proline racemase